MTDAEKERIEKHFAGEDMDDRPAVVALFANLKTKLPELKALLDRINSEWFYEDNFYRFYHQSFKVYYAQGTIEECVMLLEGLQPGVPLNNWFVQIVKDGTLEKFESSHNNDWLKHTRPILEALAHCKYFLEMAVKYGTELEKPITLLPNGWAAFLYLYGLR